MRLLRQSVMSVSSFLSSNEGRVAALAFCWGSGAMLPGVGSAAVIGPAGAVPGSAPTSVVDVTIPGTSYSLSPTTNLNAGGFDLRDLFGGSYGTNGWEHGDVLFSDGQSRGTVNAVTITLGAPVALNDFQLFLEDDGANGNRSASEFMLYSGSTLIDDVMLLDNSGTQSYTSVYGSNSIVVSDSLADVSASSTYTLAFVQNQDAGSSSGIRASEFTATAGTSVSEVPEPASLSLVMGTACWAFSRSRRRAKLNA